MRNCAIRSGLAAGLALGAMFCRAAESGGMQTALPEIDIPACNAPPLLDGVLTDRCWQAAAVLTNLTVYGKQGETTGHKVFLAHDANWLYLACAVEHPAPAHIKRTVLMPDGALHRDDSVEVFLDPAPAGSFYAHYILNAENIKADQAMLRDGKSDRETRMPWRSAVCITAAGWNAEMAFPLRHLSKYQDRVNAGWTNARMNVCVNVVRPIFDPYGARMAEETVAATWAPMKLGFHDPDCFGVIQPLNLEPASAPLFLPGLTAAQPDGYAVQDGRGCWTMTARLTNASAATGAVALIVRDQPVSGEAQEVRELRDIGAGQAVEINARIPIVAPGQRYAVVRLNDAREGGTWESRYFSESAMQVTEPLDACLDRSYYTGELQAYVRGTTALDEDSRRDLWMVVRDDQGRELGRAAMRAEMADLALPLREFADGEHNLAVELRRAAGAPLAARPVTLVKHPPNPGCEVKVDRFHGVLLKNDRPYFPFGLYVLGLDAGDEAYFRRMAAANFNLVCREMSRNIELDSRERQAYWEMAGRYGMDVIDWVVAVHPMPAGVSGIRRLYNLKVYDQAEFTLEEELAVARSEFNDLLPELRAAWSLARTTPNYLASYQVDEPNLGGDVRREANMAVAELFKSELTGTDPYHPAIMVYACHIPAGRRWTDYADILAYDPYLYAGWGRFDYCAPNFMSFKVDELVRRAASAGRVPWVVPLAESVDVGRMPRPLKPAEQECQTWLALIHGAKGLVYFVNTAIYTQSGWDVLSRLGERMKIIGPAIVAPAAPQAIDYAPLALDIPRRQFPDVQVRLFRHPDGRHLLLAANSAPYPVTVDYTLSGLQAAGSGRNPPGAPAVENLFGGATWPVQDHSFQDELEGYGVRAYVVRLRPPERSATSALPSPIHIAVSSQARPGAAAVDKPFPISAIMQRKNKMPNPSFETISLPGAPDYVRPLVYLSWPLVGMEGARWGADTNAPFHGKASLRIAHDWKGGEPPGATYRITQAVCYIPPAPAPRPYVLSFYARAARAEDELSVHVYGFRNSGSDRWKLTRDWRRYVFAGEILPNAGTSVQAVNFYTWSKDAVIWLDALQMEAGAAPSEFTAE